MVKVETRMVFLTLQTKLSQRFPGIKFTVKPKADALFPIVSAASIAAKVSRDRCIEKLGPGVGSGYPADPKTKQYLTRACDRVFGWVQMYCFNTDRVIKLGRTPRVERLLLFVYLIL